MAEPWLSIIGLGEDGLAGLPEASLAALRAAEVVFGAPRHLTLAGAGARGRAWPVPFDIAPVLALRGQRVAVLASGDPFWFGAGGSLAAALSPQEWQAFPLAGTFSHAAARLGWRLEDVACHGLHDAPAARLAPWLHPGRRGIVLLRDARAAGGLADWLMARGYGASRLWLLEALGGPRERVRETTAAAFATTAGQDTIATPVAMAIEARGPAGLPATAGRADSYFRHDGQITKAPVRALTLAALAPRAGERLWDLGAGSGSVGIEWALAGGITEAVEIRPDRAGNIRANINAFGLDHRIRLHIGDNCGTLALLPPPDAIFAGGGFDADLFATLPRRARLVVNAVTLETQALLTSLHGHHGGTLMKIDIAQAGPLGPGRGWDSARGLLQWSLPPCG